MKSKRVLFVAAGIALMVLSACAYDKMNHRESVTILSDEFDTVDAKGTQNGGGTTRVYHVDNFEKLKASGAFTVNYQQADRYEVKLTGEEKDLAAIQVYVDEGKLVLEKKRNDGKKMGLIVVDIVAPRLNSVDNSGKMKFCAQDFKAEDLLIDNSGSLRWETGTITCRSLKIDDSGSGSLVCNVRAKELVKLDLSGAFNFNGNIECDGFVDYDNSGSDNFAGKIKAKSMEMDNSGAANWNVDIEGDNLKIDTSGSCTAELKFKSGSMHLENSGVGKMEIECYCAKLYAKSSGVSTIRFKGTVDDAKLSSTGVTKIDSEQLNLY